MWGFREALRGSEVPRWPVQQAQPSARTPAPSAGGTSLLLLLLLVLVRVAGCGRGQGVAGGGSCCSKRGPLRSYGSIGPTVTGWVGIAWGMEK